MLQLAAGNETQTRLATGVMNLVKPRFSMDMRKNFFTVRVADSWNSVPDELKMAENTWQFKKLYMSIKCCCLKHRGQLRD